MKILVLAGGTSNEREVSLRSGAAVHKALLQAGHDAELYDLTTDSIDVSLSDFDVVFPTLHGTFGEDGQLQKLLETAGAQFVASGSIASALCFDKIAYRDFLAEHNVLIAGGGKVTFDEFIRSDLIQKPYVLKPFDGGSSLDMFIVRAPTLEQNEQVAEVFNRYPAMLLEALIEGTEITVGVLHDQPLPVIEIIPPSDGEFDYENKYNGRTQELCPAVNISAELQIKAQDLALQIHTLTGCQDVSRTDMIVTADGLIYVLETNTLPGMTDQSLFPKAAATAGITMTELCDRLAKQAFSRRIADA